MQVYLQGQPLQLHPQQVLGKGGEADIFRLGSDRALKLFKPPDHPDYQHQPQAQQAAAQRLAEHQQKLRQFPRVLPARVVQPLELVTDRSGQTILGYTMLLIAPADPLWRYSDRGFHNQGLRQATVVEIFQDLHATVTQLHAAGIVIGDFNDLNVLVQGSAAYCIDADSYQFAGFRCHLFTTSVVDPCHCDPAAVPLILAQPHNENSDWYAFNVLLLQSLLCVGPYGGVYKPADPQQWVSPAARPLQRLTIFHPDVRYPKPAFPYASLPDDLLQHFYQTFTQDQRGPFPAALLANLRWQTCPQCQLEHARPTCPVCRTTPVALGLPPLQTITVRGRVTAQTLYRTEGLILAATAVDTTLHWLAWDQGAFKREDGRLLLHGQPSPALQFILHGPTTFVCQQGQAIALNPPQPPEPWALDPCGTALQLASNGHQRVWLHQGQLQRDGRLGPDYIGTVLTHQTRIWLGPRFGFGFYRAGRLSVAFVFSPQRAGLNDSIVLDWGEGQLLDSACAFSGDRCWFFRTLATPTGRTCLVAVLDAQGSVLAQQAFDPAQTPWLTTLPGKCAVGHYLLAATDTGIVRLEVQQGRLAIAQTFPDTEPWVDATTQLFVGSGGLYTVSAQQIQHLQLT